ncbi:putative glycoside hydrolase [Patescibacteria group bacterium]|nr:putative glycoside hydrolase [Patescibacteria group bacterium]
MEKAEHQQQLNRQISHNTEKPGLRQKSVRFGLLFVILAALPLAYYLIPETIPDKYRPLFVAEKPGAAAVRAVTGPGIWPEPREIHIPKEVKGIYVSAATAGYKSRFNELITLVNQTELNAMVIDVKDHRGYLAFIPDSESLKAYTATIPELGALKDFTAPLKEQGIYLIARLFVFQDPAFAEAHPEWAVASSGGGLWRDYRGTPWLDPASKNVWRYNVAVAREAFAGGFDEVQFDYIRFPSDGNLKTMVFPVWDGQKPRSEVMTDFFTYLDRELRVTVGMPISVDLFGLTMWQHEYDLNIGQKLVDALSRFDFISPMVYPSHYPAGFNGYANPADRPYDVVYQNLIRGQAAYELFRGSTPSTDSSVTAEIKLATFRPWIQDFDLGAVYTPEMVRAQITATRDGGGTGWLLWNARNVYTEAALESVSSAE